MISFYLNKDRIDLQDFKPDLTLLEYLRDTAGKTGTKEGCASGDCGACTVTIADIDQGQLRYRSINSCLVLIGTLHGKQIITVEDLASDDALHPLQQAFVKFHASQCGFCTPGFIMSAFTLAKEKRNPERDDIITALGGNLCRCTGYQPIIDATLHYLQDLQPDHIDNEKASTINSLQSIPAESGTENNLIPRFESPENLADLFATLSRQPDAFVFCGGTDSSLEITQQLRSPAHLIYLGNVRELQKLEEHPDQITMGAAVSYSQAETLLGEKFPAMKEFLDRLGSRQIRNLGTIGGNIANASPIGDMPPALLALGASLTLQKNLQSRTIKLSDFFLDYKTTALKSGEIIRDIHIPLLSAQQQLFVYKISKRYEDDISTVCGAFFVELENQVIKKIRIAFGGMAAISKRATLTEQFMAGQSLTEQLVLDAGLQLEKEFSPITDVRSSASYRLTIAKNLLRRLLLDCSGSSTPKRVHKHGQIPHE